MERKRDRENLRVGVQKRVREGECNADKGYIF